MLLNKFALEVLLFLYNTRHYFHTGWSVTAWNFYTNARILRSYYSMRCRYRYRRPRFQQLKGNIKVNKKKHIHMLLNKIILTFLFAFKGITKYYF
jgi:hypothetical protein